MKDLQALGAAEVKLLYTMQWILLYASEECADAEAEDFPALKDPTNRTNQYLFSVPTITVNTNVIHIKSIYTKRFNF